MAERARMGIPLTGLQDRLAHLSVRRIIQVILLILIVVGVTLGTWKTLTLPKTSPGHFSGAAWRDLVVFGVAQGSIYAMIALGYTMVYGVLLMINFAHGEVFMTGAFASFFVASSLDGSGFLAKNPILSIAILILVGFESVTSMGEEAKDAKRDIPRAVILSLLIQGLVCYLIEYFAGWIRDAPVLLLCLARPDLLDRQPTWLGPRPESAFRALMCR